MNSTAPLEDLRIRGEFTPDPQVCRFVVSKPVLEDDWTFQFRSPADAPGSELIASIFAVEGVADVKIHREVFTITKKGNEAWPKLAGRLIPVLKRHLLEGTTVLDAARREEIKTAPLAAEVPVLIERILEQSINPALASHGGWVKLVRIEGQDVYVEMGGGCQGCASSRATMKFGIERAIREAVPSVRNVIDATNHAAGSNPYYT